MWRFWLEIEIAIPAMQPGRPLHNCSCGDPDLYTLFGVIVERASGLHSLIANCELRIANSEFNIQGGGWVVGI